MTDHHAERQRSQALAEKRQGAHEFLEKLCSQQYVICEWKAADPADPNPGTYEPVLRTIDVWLEQFFGPEDVRAQS